MSRHCDADRPRIRGRLGPIAGKYSTAVGLLDRRRLRAIYFAARHDADGSDGERETDPDLVALAAAPYESVDEAETRLGELESALRDRGDRRAVFLTVYTGMTRAMRRRIGSGRFGNPGWIREYTVAFANYYRRAFLAFERGNGERTPAPWRIAFGSSIAGNALIVQDVALGINAHVNYDLALTIHDVGIEADRASKRADHRAVDDVLASIVDAQQRALAELYAPGIDDVDAVLGPLDEAISLFGLTEGRERAWRVATVMTDFDATPVETYARWVLRTTATGGAAFALAPTADPATMATLERIERDRIDLDDAVREIDDRIEALEGP